MNNLTRDLFLCAVSNTSSIEDYVDLEIYLSILDEKECFVR